MSLFGGGFRQTKLPSKQSGLSEGTGESIPHDRGSRDDVFTILHGHAPKVVMC